MFTATPMMRRTNAVRAIRAGTRMAPIDIGTVPQSGDASKALKDRPKKRLFRDASFVVILHSVQQ